MRIPTAQDMHALGVSLGKLLRAGDLVLLDGPLGAGKTAFAKGFGAGLGVDGTISSPSFILMAEYAGRLPLFHVDLYRLDDARDVLAGGLLAFGLSFDEIIVTKYLAGHSDLIQGAVIGAMGVKGG